MKKTLVAIAALASVSAFAQVTITGNMDFAGAKVGGSQLWAMGSTISQTVGTMSTSVINIRAVDDIGGGIKVTGHYGLDPRLLANDSLAVTNNTGAVVSNGGQAGALPGMAATTGTVVATATLNSVLGTVGGQSNTATGLGRDELFVGIEGGFGNIRLGSPNSIGLNTFQNGSPAGTGIGGGYTGGGTSGTMTNSFVQTRYNRSVRYDSPVMSGFTVSAMYAPGNAAAAQTVGVDTKSATNQSISSSAIPVALLIPNARAAQEYGIKYANGPLTVAYANISQDIQLNSTGWYANGSNTKGLKTSANYVTASYVLGNTTVYAGWNDGQRLAPIGSAGVATNANVDSKGNRFAIKQTMGNISLMASLTTQQALGVTAITVDSGTTTATTGAAQYTTSVLKAKVLGFRGEYNLSKSSALYAGYEKYETGADYVATALTTTGNRTITSVGLKSTF
jgi:predicted porin